MRTRDFIFLTSGAAALVYETVWIRLLARVLGSDAASLALVLGAFMGGMGLGALLLAGPARRTRAPERLYALLLFGLAGWAALSPLVLERLAPLEGFAARALTAAAVLLPPTVAMGGTFPLMARLAIAARARAGRAVSEFYGANTLGAALGACLGPFVLMPALGLARALVAAAGLDAAAALFAWRWLRAPAPDPVRPAERRGRRPSRSTGAAWRDPYVLAAAGMGLIGLGLEVVLSRVLVTVTGASVYAYGIVLAVFLVGIGAGSRALAHEGAALCAGPRLFARCAAFLPALTLAGVFLLERQLGEPDLFAPLANRMPAGAGVWRLWALHAVLAGLVLLPLAVALGAALPSAAAALLERRSEANERLLGILYAANTAGAFAGSLLAGFVLLPSLGPRGSLLALLALALAIALALPGRQFRPLLLAVAAAAALLPTALPSEGPQGKRRLVTAFDAHATAVVTESTDAVGRAVRALRVDGKVVATTAPVDLRLQRLLGAIPAVLHGNVHEALVVGLGTGMTAGVLLELPDLEGLDVVEISPAVREAARAFTRWNRGVLDDRRTRLRIDDGRRFLATSEGRWDLLTSDPIHPWTRGSSDLYSLEHFRLMRAHLAPGGVASQWLPLYQLSLEDVRTVAATWCASFEHVSAWLTAYDLALVGSAAPLPGEARLGELVLPPGLAQSLAEAGIHSAGELAVLLVADDGELRAFAADTPPMVDDRPVLEFRAPRSFLAGYCVPALRWAARPEPIERLPSQLVPRARAVRAALERFLDALPGGLSAAAARYGEELLALPPLPR